MSEQRQWKVFPVGMAGPLTEVGIPHEFDSTCFFIVASFERPEDAAECVLAVNARQQCIDAMQAALDDDDSRLKVSVVKKLQSAIKAASKEQP